ncbi:Type VI secretion system protein ImpB [Bosea sp. 62]|uniref:type VI secretion system contractile sheath small subunit n=1 Tax=unclassified Bosea (in: a-proteobacteria) TaxID=2653178 RepID=UPI00125A3E00|nr:MULTISPECIES: type VI secretion system contractile sheath small subunit [unclassified Bosea (in: a-proteobacteria)]CAD5293902.1 Type VI secretion system protein ImpB [Bosea sp. 21B]CAD5294504.1 Type VI secretion system protein ImpB [Bosea sp. 46]CAD5298997.1 Type VI secretion system protein ImpB [Bosea sp. 7B]VVT60819.1 Type VI secretion system protein ImpB [Bosea sp. EC-HK365B]VXB40248.1 Type VI secretion system protein ImpB [Bosea sp. 127]
MSKEVSVAPKERVNIKFKPATGNVKEEVELPLKLLMVGDFTGRADDRPVEERSLADINKDNFDDVLKGHELKLDVAVANKLDEAADAPDVRASLSFNKLKDFEPDAVARQVPELRKLMELREALVAMKGPLGNVPAFRKAIQSVLEDDAAREKLLRELTGSGDGKTL